MPGRKPRAAARGRAPRPLESLVRDRGYWLLVAWLGLTFFLGGGARGDIASLMVLRPLSALLLAYALAGLTAGQVRANRFLLGMALAWLVLLMVHLVPLPPALWQALPGRGIVGEIDRAAGLGDTWRPLSMVPHATRSALWATLAPLVVIVLGVQLSDRQRARLLPPVLVLGGLSALVALLQVLGDPHGPLYFYRVTNHGSAVGLFANRNHQAVLLAVLLPVLLVWARTRQGGGRPGSRQQSPWIVALAGGCVLVPLILVTGSRAGLIAAVLALITLPALLTHASAPDSRRGWRLAGWLIPLAILLLAGLTLLLDRALAVDRLLLTDATADMRLRLLPALLAMIRDHAPWGSGIGTFEQVYRLHEPDALLAPFYMNHAHNDWLELALTGGVPAVLLAAAAAGAFLVALARAFAAPARDETALLKRLGLAMLFIFALASLSDYPLRVPSLACLAAIAVLWASARTIPTPTPTTAARFGEEQ